MSLAPRQRSLTTRRILLICAVLVCAVFLILGSWQVKRLQWKLDLIKKVEQRVHAAPVAAPAPALWPQLTVASDAYKHVRLSGIFLYDRTTAVQAVTELGSGFWLLTPLCSLDGSIVLINRGFVPDLAHAPVTPVSGPAVCAAAELAGGPVSLVDGLLRLSEPGGAFLRHNDALNNHWYSRDVAALAAARELGVAAPYFIDAGVESVPPDAGAEGPVAGLTVISFPNNHLVYAFTWYILALMTAGACVWVVREEKKLLHRGTFMEREDARKK